MKRKILDFMLTACCMAFSFLGLVACDNELDIRQEYPFAVESMPVADEITDGETVEIRLEIKPEGNFAGTVYTLRYFQPDGKGSLKMEDGTVLKPNDRYLLNEWKFRLYYTSQSGKTPFIPSKCSILSPSITKTPLSEAQNSLPS